MRIEGTPPEQLKPELRGLEKFAKPAEDIGETVMESVTEDPKVILRGLEKFPIKGAELKNREIAVGTKAIQRDTGLIYEIEAIVDERNGKSAQLFSRDSEGNRVRRVNLRPEDLKQKLEEPGGPWSWAD